MSGSCIRYAYDVERWRPSGKEWVIVGTRFTEKAARTLSVRYAAMGTGVRIQKRVRHLDETRTEPLRQGELFE